jgi:hypothetical protein
MEETRCQFDTQHQTTHLVLQQNAHLMEENEFLRQKLGESPPRRRGVAAMPLATDEMTALTRTAVNLTGTAVDTDVAAYNEGSDAELELKLPAKKPRMLEQVLDASAGPSSKIGGILASDALQET